MKKKPSEKQSEGIYSRYTPSEAKAVKSYSKKHKYASVAEFQRKCTLDKVESS